MGNAQKRARRSGASAERSATSLNCGYCFSIFQKPVPSTYIGASITVTDLHAAWPVTRKDKVRLFTEGAGRARLYDWWEHISLNITYIYSYKCWLSSSFSLFLPLSRAYSFFLSVRLVSLSNNASVSTRFLITHIWIFTWKSNDYDPESSYWMYTVLGSDKGVYIYFSLSSSRFPALSVFLFVASIHSKTSVIGPYIWTVRRVWIHYPICQSHGQTNRSLGRSVEALSRRQRAWTANYG